MKIRGNTVGVPNPQPDWNQTDPTKANYIRNKPSVDGGESGGAEVFIATYGETTFAEIYDAYLAGKAVFLIQSTSQFYLAKCTSSSATFVSVDSTSVYYKHVTESGWSSTYSKDINNRFVATYGETTYANIVSARDTGKICFCKHESGWIFPLIGVWASQIQFAGCYVYTSGLPVQIVFAVSKEGVWTKTETLLKQTSEITSESTTQLPTAKAVYDYAQPKGDYLTKNQGSANVGKILVVGTDGNLTLTDMPAGGGDVTGTIDENNNILLSGNLASGTYTLKYENQDGTYTEIGTLEVGEIGGYTNLFSTSGDGFANNTDFSGASSGRFLTNYIPCKDGDVLHLKGATIYKLKAHNSVSNTWGSAVYAASLGEAVSSYDDAVKVYNITQATTGVSNIDKVQLEIRSGNTALDSVIITVNQDIVD